MVAAPRLDKGIPPLENGMRMEREEFHVLFTAHPEIKKAELVDGVVFMPSPTRFAHSDARDAFAWWLKQYVFGHDGVQSGGDATVILPGGQEVMPDVLMRWEAGATALDADGYLHGAPELVVEVAASSASFDLHQKRDAYRRAGVAEYIVYQVYERRLRWFRLDGTAYDEVETDEHGAIASEQFPGLALNVAALEAGDVKAALGL